MTGEKLINQSSITIISFSEKSGSVRISRPLLNTSAFFLLFDLLLPDVEGIAGFYDTCKSSLEFSNDPRISSSL